MSENSGPQYQNPDGSFTRKRPGLPSRRNSEARAFSRQLAQDKPKKIDPDTAKKIAEALKVFLSN